MFKNGASKLKWPNFDQNLAQMWLKKAFEMFKNVKSTSLAT